MSYKHNDAINSQVTILVTTIDNITGAGLGLLVKNELLELLDVVKADILKEVREQIETSIDLALSQYPNGIDE